MTLAIACPVVQYPKTKALWEATVRISVIEAEEQLDELVEMAEAGEEVILTIDGRPVVQLTPVEHAPVLDDGKWE